MIEQLLHRDVQEFIFAHEQDDEKALVLKHKTILGLPASLIAEQIGARRKAKSKLPLYYNTPGIIYPQGINLEQSSSEKTAQYKSEILSILASNKALADVTGGFGIDSFFLSKIFDSVYHVEPNASLQQIAQHNHAELSAKNITYQNTKAEDFLKTCTHQLNCIFIDPSRRNAGQKVFRLSDCEPDVVRLLPDFFTKADYVLIKTSPLLDIQQGIQDLRGVEKIWVVAVDNECKELLFLCHKDFSGEPEISAINIQTDREEFSFLNSVEKKTESVYSKPLLYIYEPNAAILKAGAFKSIGKQCSLFKLHSSTHLYTSSEKIENFPGRVFKKIKQVKPEAKALIEVFPQGKANIITRNYPLSVEALKKKTKLNDGGELYLLGFSGPKEKYLIAAERIK
jgi:hypothetical protein